MGFEPHSVAGSALKLASRLPLRGPAPSCAPHERGHPFRNPLSWVQIQSGLTPNASRITLERAMGFEPTTTSEPSSRLRCSNATILIVSG